MFCHFCGSEPRPIPDRDAVEHHWVLWDDRLMCNPCLVLTMGEAEKAWLTEHVAYIEDPKRAADILRRLYGPR